jgi:hypothetical protein
MKHLPSYLLLLVGFVGHGIQAQSTVSTPIVGFETKSFSGGTTGNGLGFVKPAVFSGASTSVTSGTVTSTGANFTALGAGLNPVGGLPTHYVEITSGTLAGYVADVLSSTSTSLTVDGDLTSILGTMPNLVVRPHIKVSDVFQGNASLTDYVDTATVYNPDGSATSLLRDSSSPTGWVDPNSFAAADFIVYPGQAILVSVSGNGTVTVTGQVKTTPTIVPLYASAPNYVTLGNPSGNKALQTSGLGENLVDFVDTVAGLSTDGSFNQTGIYLWGGSSDGFIDPNSFSPVSGVSIPGSGAVLVSVSADTYFVAPAPVNPSQPKG